MNTFMDLFMQGIVKASDIGNFVKTWSSGSATEPDLAIFLGMTVEECRDWEMKGNDELEIIKKKRISHEL